MMVSVSPENGKIEAGGKVETRSVFISHSHADRGLAKGLIELVEAVFSGVVVPFASSDPAPTGGLMPGDDWFAQIHARLRASEAVWVVATPHSITRPWIYWESGIGRAICPRGLVVLRVGLTAGEVPSPLSALQAYDGLSEGDDGVGVMLGKVAAQIGMKPHPLLLEKCTVDWIALAKAHKPETEGVAPAPAVAPEQLNRLEAIIARLEATAAGPMRPLEASDAAIREARRGMLQRIVGNPDLIYFEVDEFEGAIGAAPPDTSFRAQRIDGDGDAAISVTRGDDRTWIYLHSTALPLLSPKRDTPERTAKLIEDIVKLYQAAVTRPAPPRRRRQQPA